MMLNLRIVELIDTFLNYLPIGGFFGSIFLFEFLYFFKLILSTFDYSEFEYIYNYINYIYIQNNLILIGEILFNYNSYLVIIASLILFVSMFVSIILTFDINLVIKFKNKNQLNLKFDKKYISFWQKL